MEEFKKTYDIGVVIGRFQIDDPHSEHIKLIEEVIKRHSKVLVLLGCSTTLSTKRNPLDYVTRKVMMEEIFGDKIVVDKIYDQKSDNIWSKKVDATIREVFPIGSVLLYGAKDSFIPYYKGIFDTQVLVPDNYVSASDVRNRIKNQIVKDTKFRQGVIYNSYNTYPKVYSTVDVCIFNNGYTKILLGKKPNEEKYRFIGGFVDVKDKDLITTVKRETHEECGLEIDDIKYIGSTQIDDWRYRNEEDKIMTHLHICRKIFGNENAKDDIVGLKWFDFNESLYDNIEKEHIILLDMLFKNLKVE